MVDRKGWIQEWFIIGIISNRNWRLHTLPTAAARYICVFLIALFVMGTGLAILLTAANPYVDI
jgi:uncharacterized membrane protein YczE